MNSLRMNPLGPLSVERTSSHSPCFRNTVTFVPMVKVVKEAAEKFGSVRSEVAYLIWKTFPSSFTAGSVFTAAGVGDLIAPLED